jgi:hypothetical protein
MKILKNTDTITISCNNCKSELEITKFDVDYKNIFGHGIRIRVKCPVCDHYIPVSALMPKHWMDWFYKQYEEEEDVHG